MIHGWPTHRWNRCDDMMVWTMSVCLCRQWWDTFRNVVVSEIRDLDRAGRNVSLHVRAALKCEFHSRRCKTLRQFSIFFHSNDMRINENRHLSEEVFEKCQRFIPYSKRWPTACYEKTNMYNIRFFSHGSLIRIIALHLCTIHWWWSMHYSNNLHNIAIGTEGCLPLTLRHAKCSSLLCMYEHRAHCIPANQRWYGFTLPNRDRFSGAGVQIRCDFLSHFNFDYFLQSRIFHIFFYCGQWTDGRIEHETHDFWIAQPQPYKFR